MYGMYTHCIGCAVSVLLCDSFVGCNRPCRWIKKSGISKVVPRVDLSKESIECVRQETPSIFHLYGVFFLYCHFIYFCVGTWSSNLQSFPGLGTWRDLGWGLAQTPRPRGGRSARSQKKKGNMRRSAVMNVNKESLPDLESLLLTLQSRGSSIFFI